MHTLFSTRILDNDNKGKSGRGTKFRLEIKVLENNIENKISHDYYLMDLLDGSFDVDKVKLPFIEKQKKFNEMQEKLIQEEKNKISQERLSSIESSSDLDAILDECISQNAKAISEYKSGKEKALNSIVGMVMKTIKSNNIKINDAAFTVYNLLKQRIEDGA